MLVDVLPYAFTAQTGAEAGKRSGLARRERSYLKATFDKPPSVDKVQAELNHQAKLVKQQIELTVNALNGKDGEVTHSNRAALLKALDTLLDRQRVLLNVPDPGTNRPRQSRPDRSQSMSALPATPQPVVFSVPAPVQVQPQSIPSVQDDVAH